MVLNHLENKLTGWVQNKRLFKDLIRINLHEVTELRLLQVIQVFLSSPLSNINVLPSFVAMEGEKDPNPPAQATKPKKSLKSKLKTTLGVSQKAHVVKTTKSQPVGSEQVSKNGEGLGENQRTQNNKEGKVLIDQPRHDAPSQKDACINKESKLITIHSLSKGFGY